MLYRICVTLFSILLLRRGNEVAFRPLEAQTAFVVTEVESILVGLGMYQILCATSTLINLQAL